MVSGISRHSAVFFQTEDFGSVFFNTFLVSNRLGHPMHPLSRNCATFAGHSNRMAARLGGKNKRQCSYLSIYCNLGLKSVLKMGKFWCDHSEIVPIKRKYISN